MTTLLTAFVGVLLGLTLLVCAGVTAMFIVDTPIAALFTFIVITMIFAGILQMVVTRAEGTAAQREAAAAQHEFNLRYEIRREIEADLDSSRD